MALKKNKARTAKAAGRVKTTVTAPVNIRRAGPKTVAAAIVARGEEFGRETWAQWNEMLAKRGQTAQVEPRTPTTH